MQQTNYQLFDFLDFSTDLNQGDRLWRACAPTNIIEKQGEIFVTIPFHKQHNSNEITPDLSAERKEYVLRIKAFGNKILRVSMALTGRVMEDSEMLEMDFRLQPTALRFEKTDLEWIIKDLAGNKKAVISFSEPQTDYWSDLVQAPSETIQLSFFADAKKEVALSAYDMFSPARHDAFALAYIERNEEPHRVTFSIKAKADECYYGTGERFSKMDLSGKTFQLRNQDGQGVNNRRAYKNIPFYLSSENYGLFLHSTSFAKFSLADILPVANTQLGPGSLAAILGSVLELEKLNAIQWTPGYGEPQGGNAKWYDLYKKILAGGKSVMANWVTMSELEPLLDTVGNQGLHINVDFKSEKEIEQALRIMERYR